MKKFILAFVFMTLSVCVKGQTINSVKVWYRQSSSHFHIDKDCEKLIGKNADMIEIRSSDINASDKLYLLIKRHPYPCEKCSTPDMDSIKTWIGVKAKETPKAEKAKIMLSTIRTPSIEHNELIISPIFDKIVTTSRLRQVGMRGEWFEVIQSNDQNLIGCRVMCQVVETRRSNILGSEGRLIIRPLYVTQGNNRIELHHDDIHLRGKNRTNVKFWTAILFPPMVFIPGTGAKASMFDRFCVTMR